ncbi:MAG: vWA domain-containing protein [Gaiellaceae bacterium]
MLSRHRLRFWARSPSAIDSPDARAFPAGSRRTRLIRIAFAGAAVALLLAAASSARDLETKERGLLPTGTVGVVVVDLSLSIADEDYTIVRRALSTLIAEDARIGLVVFSDVPYELLPPGTPASEMRPMLRLLVPPRLGPPVNPWTQTFRAGTRISAALELARTMLERDGVARGSILLVSDLDTAPDDIPALARTVEDLRRSAIELRVVPLAPSSDAQLLFEGLLETDRFAAPSDLIETAGSSVATTRLPLALLVLGGLLFIALAAHERFGSRLAIARAPATRGTST